MKKILQCLIILLLTTSSVLAQGFFERFFRSKGPTLIPFPGKEHTFFYCPSPSAPVAEDLLSTSPSWCVGRLPLDPCHKENEPGGVFDELKNICVHCDQGFTYDKTLSECR